MTLHPTRLFAALVVVSVLAVPFAGAGFPVCAASDDVRAPANPTVPAGEQAVMLAPLVLNGTLPLGADSRLRKNVEFWVRIYTQYYTHQGLVHDAKYVDKVYQVVDNRRESGREAKRHWREVLLRVHRKQARPETFDAEERRVFEMFRDIDEPNKFLNAAHRKRLRLQIGQKENYLAGLRASGRYLDKMEEIFRREGMPIELTRLPFVESSFNLRARSKVGASGIWQFMRSTGQLFLRVDDAVDERNDPLLATAGAARLLRANYDSLRNWGLAVTAYNHGRKGMMRAVRKVGSEELDDVVSGYRSRTFGFASGNFFAELLAAIEVERHANKYFGKVERDKPAPYFEVELPDSIELPHLTRFLQVNPASVRDLNPALQDLIYSGKRRIPAGYKLRLPLKSGASASTESKVFLAGYSQIPAMFKGR